MSNRRRRITEPSNTDNMLSGLHIAIDGRYLSRPGMGINRYVIGIVDTLNSNGAAVTVLTNRKPEGSIDGDVLVFGSEKNIIWDQVSLVRHLRHHKYDLYVAPANAGIALFAPRSQKMVVSILDLIPLLMPVEHVLRRPLYGVPYIMCVLAAAARANAVLCPSSYSAQVVHTWLRRRADICSPLLIRPIESQNEASPRAGCWHKLAPYVLYHGGVGARKRVDTLLRAIALAERRGTFLPNLVLLGKHYEVFDELIGALDIGHLVHRPGYVSEAERDDWVRNAWAIAYPSRMEGFGLPLLEGMSAGVPVITSDNSSLSEVGGDAVLFADPDTPGDYAEAFVRLTEPATRARLVAAGYRRRARYDVDAERMRLCELIRLWCESV